VSERLNQAQPFLIGCFQLQYANIESEAIERIISGKSLIDSTAKRPKNGRHKDHVVAILLTIDALLSETNSSIMLFREEMKLLTERGIRLSKFFLKNFSK
jgi:hypothetical protein